MVAQILARRRSSAIEEARAGVPWRRWGPYLSERQRAEFPYADLAAVNRSRSRETNTARLWGKESTTRFAKDGIGDCVLHGADTVNPAGEGTKGYAAWDLAFHCISLAIVDPDFAKSQIDLMLSQDYLHPTGQMPAYEWNFGDVNPPVHASRRCSCRGWNQSWARWICRFSSGASSACC